MLKKQLQKQNEKGWESGKREKGKEKKVFEERIDRSECKYEKRERRRKEKSTFPFRKRLWWKECGSSQSRGGQKELQ